MTDSSDSSPPKKRTRGATTMTRFITSLEAGKRFEVDFDEVTFAPRGEYAAKFISYVSYLARSKVDINNENWKAVHKEVKDKLWQDITERFTCPTPTNPNDDKFKKKWLVHMGDRWKHFKADLTDTYVFGNGDKDGNSTPILKYKYISEDQWNKFVKSRTTTEFLEKRERGKKNASKNVHPHILSRGGYDKLKANMMEERMKQMLEEGSLIDLPTLPRYEVWLKARTKPSGDYTSEETKMVASKIEELVEQSTQGTYVPQGREDILTEAIGTQERPGRVRTAGWYMGFKEYYGKSTRSTSQRISMDDLVAVRKHMEQNMENKIREKVENEFENKLKEMKKVQQEEMEKFQREIERNFSQQLTGMKELMLSMGTNNCDAAQNFVSQRVTLDTSTEDSCSEILVTNEEDFIKKIANFKENMIKDKKETLKIELDHDKINPYFYVDIDDLNDMVSIKWLSMRVLSLWCTYLHRLCISKGSSEQFGFFDPLKTFNSKPGDSDTIQVFIQNKLINQPKKCYLGPRVNGKHWQLFVICPDDNKIYWFCSLGSLPNETFKGVLERAVRGYNTLIGRRKKPRLIPVTTHQQDNDWACGYYVMKNMFDIVQTGIFQRLDEIYDDPSPYEKDVVDDMRQHWAQFFLQIVKEQQQQNEDKC